MSAEQLAFSRGELLANALVTGNAAAGEAIGQIRAERIQRQIDALAEFRIVEQPVTTATVLNRGFLPEALR